MFSECQNKSQSLHFSRSNHRKNANRVSLTFGVIPDFISKYLELFDEKPKKIARLESGESSIVPNDETDLQEEKSEVSNFKISGKYTKERFQYF